jgi:hypothetical protein
VSDLREQATWHRCPDSKHGDHGPQCVLAIGHGQRDEPHLWSDATEEIAEHIYKLQVSYNAANAMAGVGRRHLERLWETRKRAEQAAAILRDLVDPDPCYFDHNGYCQAHGCSPPCAHARARDHLAALAHPDDQSRRAEQ